VFETDGIGVAESLRGADTDAVLFLVTILRRCRNEQVGRAIVAHVLGGRLRLAALKPLSMRLGGRADASTVRVRPELIAVFGFKIYGFSNQEIADHVGLSVKRVKNIGTELYQPWVGATGVSEQKKLTLLWRAAVDEGYVETRPSSRG
jgi:DNA-binding NarL/FixJ family response regulator